MAAGRSLRLFIAFDVPEDAKRSIEKVIQPMRLLLPEAKWTTRDHWHVTLKFLGHVAEDRLDEITRVARKAGVESHATESRLTGVGVFPSPKRARVFWVGLEDPGTVLGSLAADLERRYAKRGFKKESRAYHPHLTVARLRTPKPAEEALDQVDSGELDLSPFKVSEITLYQSHLSPKGARYESVDTFPLSAE